VDAVKKLQTMFVRLYFYGFLCEVIKFKSNFPIFPEKHRPVFELFDKQI